MKILIIGGTGTISTAVVRLLSEQGHEVSVINRGTRNAVLP
ncbi:MAG: NmrA family NAD(P)-binding protein [Treponema sp.]|nr:NmrA family NAD(P)-binding protein [Treponema sp.]